MVVFEVVLLVLEELFDELEEEIISHSAWYVADLSPCFIRPYESSTRFPPSSYQPFNVYPAREILGAAAVLFFVTVCVIIEDPLFGWK